MTWIIRKWLWYDLYPQRSQNRRSQDSNMSWLAISSVSGVLGGFVFRP